MLCSINKRMLEPMLSVAQAIRVVVVIVSVVVSIAFIDVVVVGFMFVHVIVVVTCCELSSYPVVLALFGELQRAIGS